MAADVVSARSTLSVGDRKVEIHRLDALQQEWDVARLPYTLRILLENVAPQRRPGGRRGRRGLGRGRRAEPRDLLRSGPGPAAGLHRRAGRGRPRRDARRDGRARGQAGADQSADPGRARDRPLRAGRRVRRARGFRTECRARVRAEPRAVRLPPLGPGRVPRLQGRAARDGDRPPGQPRVPRACRRGAGRRRLPGHARRHRLAHDDGERARRARLGRRRDRGGGRDAGRAALDARAPGGRLQAQRPAPGRRDRNRSRPDRDRDPPPDRRRREVRRVLRARPRVAAARRPRDDREHVAGVRRDVRLLPRRRPHPQLPAPDRPQRGAGRPRRGVLQGEPALARARGGADLLAGRRARPLDGRALARRPAPPAGPRAARARQGRVPRLAGDVRRRRMRTGARTTPSRARSRRATRRASRSRAPIPSPSRTRRRSPSSAPDTIESASRAPTTSSTTAAS